MDDKRTFRYVVGYTSRWPDRRGPWLVTLHFGLVEGRIECVGFDFRSFESGNEIHSVEPLSTGQFRRVSGSLIRQVDVAGLVRRAREDYREDMELTVHPALRDQPELKDTVKRFFEGEDSKVGRPRTYTLDHYKEVAEIYLRTWKTAGAAPTKAVQQHFDVDSSKAARWVREARKLGLIGPSLGRGKPGEARRRGGKK